ncbi:MAG: flagellin domain protein [Cyanobacteria bacterium RYN_339]|nr:flagellin domain protein [Cyanobacteria bacterium RYN_339]
MLSILAGVSPMRGFAQTELSQARSLARLSSGLRIVHAADDAAGQEIQEYLGAKVRGAHRAAANIQEALAFLKIAQDGIGGVIGVMQRMRELTVQGGNSSLAANDKLAIDQEIASLGQAMVDAQQAAVNARVNFQYPVGARFVTYQVGSDFGQTVTFDFNPLAATLSTFLLQTLTMTVTTGTTADTARTQIDAAISGTVSELAKLGGFVNSLEHQLESVSYQEILQAKSQSQIKDLDFADEMVTYVRNQVMQETAVTVARIHNLRFGALAKLIYAA